MTLQTVVEVILAVGAAFLLYRDVRRALRDRLRRPVTLLVAALVAVLLVGALGGQSYPSPWWLLVPGGILAWEVARGWRVVPRCHLREAGVGAFAVGLVLAAFGLGTGAGSTAVALLVAAGAAGAAALTLFWLSHRREPRPWRADDMKHYERRSMPR